MLTRVTGSPGALPINFFSAACPLFQKPGRYSGRSELCMNCDGKGAEFVCVSVFFLRWQWEWTRGVCVCVVVLVWAADRAAGVCVIQRRNGN